MPRIKKAPRRPWQPERIPFAQRRSANREFYASAAWRRASKTYRAAHPVCEMCRRAASEVCDHITPINQGGAPLDESNFQALCNRCHNKKSGHERW